MTAANGPDATAFVEFPSIARLSRNVTVTEKIDGTNAQVFVGEDGTVMAGSRTRWITPHHDNFGFAQWVADNADALRALDPGHHFGEWWGQRIQRQYAMNERRFSLFNTDRWTSSCNLAGDISTQCHEVPVCHVVSVLYRGPFDTATINDILDSLRLHGSVAAHGFMKPEGIVVFHKHAKALFKKTLDKNDGHKSADGAA